MSLATLLWTAERQQFSFGERSYDWEGPIGTEPEHDLAHLLIAANGGGMEWLPTGERDQICMAEYNAVLLENFLLHVNASREQPLVDAVKHSRWFCDKHYAPFPVSSEMAFHAWLSRIDPRAIARLSPIYFEMQDSKGEKGSKGDYWACFTDDETPDVAGYEVKVSRVMSLLRPDLVCV
jgi:hypothetical protein